MAMLLYTEQMMDVASMLPPYLVSLHATIKALIVVPKANQISLIIEELGSLWRSEFNETQTEEKKALFKRLNICNKANYWITVLGSFQYLLSPMLETGVLRFILRQNCELMLPIAASYGFDPTTNWMIYITVYVYQCYSMFLIVSIYMGSELIMITLCALLGTEFMMLKDDLSAVPLTLKKERNLEGNTDEVESGIEDFVKRHQLLIRLSRQLDHIFNPVIFIDLLFVGITTCAFSFAGEFARGPVYAISNYVAVLSSLLTVLYLCYFGELLTGASARIANEAYNISWYECSKEYRQAIWLIIKISQKPCCLTSLRYAVVSLNMFTKVISTTWSYMSLMNSVYKDEE